MRRHNANVHSVPQMQGVGRAGALSVRQVPDNAADAAPQCQRSQRAADARRRARRRTFRTSSTRQRRRCGATMPAFTACRRCKASGAQAHFPYVKCPTERRRCGATMPAFTACRRCKASGAQAYFSYVKCPTNAADAVPQCQRSQRAADARRRARRRTFRTSSARLTPPMRCHNASVHSVPQMQGVGRAGVLFVRQVPDNAADAVRCERWFNGCALEDASGNGNKDPRCACSRPTCCIFFRKAAEYPRQRQSV